MEASTPGNTEIDEVGMPAAQRDTKVLRGEAADLDLVPFAESR